MPGQYRYYVQAADVRTLERLAAEVQRALDAARQIQEVSDGERGELMDAYDASVGLIRTHVMNL